MVPRGGDKISWCCAVVLAAMSTVNVRAADWTTTTGLSVTERYTDNVELVDKGKESELVTVVAPNLTLKGVGGKLKVDLTAALEYNDAGGSGDSVNPRFSGNSNAELVDDRLFFDARASAVQNRIDPFRPAGFDNLSRSRPADGRGLRDGNTSTTYSYVLNPYLRGHFKDFANMRLGYTFDDQLNSSNTRDDPLSSGGDLSDSSRQAVDFNLDSGTDFALLSWGVAANYSKTDYDGSSDTGQSSDSELMSTDLRLGYRVSRKWQLRASVGKEWNDFNSVRSDVDGTRWDFGTVWTPNKRTSVNVGYGKRFFGGFPTLDVSYRRKRNVLTASYSKVLTDARTLRLQQIVFEDTDPFGNPVDPITGEPIPVSLVFVLPTDSQIVDERFKASWAIQGKRTTVTLKQEHSIQQTQDSREDTEYVTSSLSLSRTLSSKLSFDSSIHRSNQTNELNDDFNTWRFQMALNRRLGAKSNVRLGYTHADRDSDLVDDDYAENQINMTYRITF